MPIRYKDLIETNIRQRVLGNTNPVKLGRCFSFLNKWYGFGHGGDRKSSEKVFNLILSNEPHNQTELQIHTELLNRQLSILKERIFVCWYC